KLLGAPVALLADATLLLVSATILRGIRVEEHPAAAAQAARVDAASARADRAARARAFVDELQAGLRFVMSNRLLVTLACGAGTWQMCHNCATVVNILFATRTLGLSEQAVGLSYICLGV